MKRLEATVTGRVQGVGYRYFVRREADRLGLTGYVRNAPDGQTVEVVAEGEERALASLEEALRRGPGSARVTRVDAQLGAATGTFSRFSVEM